MKHFGLIGKNISYTISPFVHKRLFALKNISADYKVFDVDESDAFEVAKTLDGYNVTKPYKEVFAARLLSSAHFASETHFSVNTASKNQGFNTDVPALEKCLSDIGQSLSKTTLILGFGGLGKAVAARAASLGGKVTVAVKSNSIEKTNLAISQLKLVFPHADISVSDISAISGRFDVLINATPVGTLGNHFSCPVSDEVIGRCNAVFDSVYNPFESVLLRRAKRQNIPCSGGLEMLVRQAAAAQEIWFDVKFSDSEIALVVSQAKQQLEAFKTNVVLVGFMAAGKSTVANILAQKLFAPLFDTDCETEKLAGQSVAEIFKTQGESAFRQLEKQAVNIAASSYFSIIATGGGALEDNQNVATLKKSSKIIFLDAPFCVLAERLKHCTDRPLKNLLTLEQLEKLYAERRKVYLSVADFVVDASAPVESVIDNVISLF